MRMKKSKRGAKIKNTNAQIYTRPMHRCLVIRMTDEQLKAFAEVAGKRPSTKAREIIMGYAGVKS